MTQDSRKAPQVRVGVVTAGHPRVICRGDYRIEHRSGMTVFIPLKEDSRILAANVMIGIDFHWQQTMSMSLPGRVELRHRDDGSADLLNILDVETYLRSVISSEMSADAPLEFLKAHAVISRSWLMGKILRSHPGSSEGKKFTDEEVVNWMDTSDHSGFDVCADDHCQRYQGDARVNETVRRAVAETAGMVLCDARGDIIDARFSKCCGGRTEIFSTCWQDRDFDYLQPVDDPYCDLSKLPEKERQDVLNSVLVGYDRKTADFHDWESFVNSEDIRRRVSERYGRDLGPIQDIIPDRRGPSGRILRLKLQGDCGSMYIGKELEIRRLLSDSCLYSSWFDATKEGAGFRLRGRGWGHGVGLCQIGAAVMARKGYSAQEILGFYYPGTSLRPVYKMEATV